MCVNAQNCADKLRCKYQIISIFTLNSCAINRRSYYSFTQPHICTDACKYIHISTITFANVPTNYLYANENMNVA